MARALEHSKILLDNEQPIQKRMCSLFVLRTIADSTSFYAIVDCLTKIAVGQNPLLEHEAAYVLGQMCGVKDSDVANPHKNQPKNAEIYKDVRTALERTLCDESRDSVVRHEAGEALAAMLSYESKDILVEHWKLNGNPQEVTETCDLANQRLEWAQKVISKEKESIKSDTNPTVSVDPAPPFIPENAESIDDLVSRSCDELIDKTNSIWRRYRAMFTLRNQIISTNIKDPLINNKVVDAFAKALHCTSSALLRHEIGYVLGQVISGECLTSKQLDTLSDSLQRSVEIDDEHPMVRHESAMALGEFMEMPNSKNGPPTKKLLSQYSEVPGCSLLSDSCIVALSMMEEQPTWTAETFTVE